VAKLFDKAACGKYVSANPGPSDPTADSISGIFLKLAGEAAKVSASIQDPNAKYTVTQTSSSQDSSGQTSTTDFDFYLSPLFATSFFSLDNLIGISGSYGASGAGVKFYGLTTAEAEAAKANNRSLSTAPDVFDASNDLFILVELKATNLDKVFPSASQMLSEITLNYDQNGKKTYYTGVSYNKSYASIVDVLSK
jgi:hypothetical protein